MLFAALCAICLLVAGGYTLLASRRAETTTVASANAPASNQAPVAASLAAIRGQPYALFRSTNLGSSFGKVELAPLAEPQGPRFTTALDCERVYFAAGQGLCLRADRGVFTTYSAVLFNSDFQPRHSVPLAGIPSRARLSPDGRYAAMTVFVSGDSYASVGFSTRTTLLEAASGVVLGDLEQFDILRDGARFDPVDKNLWGVTFAQDSNSFYATLGTSGKTYLVQGDLAARQVRVLREGVECPSLSPDNTRLAFKKRAGTGGRLVWQIAVLDLSTLNETVLPLETRSVDDQVEWLDNEQVIYGLPDETTSASASTSVWSMPADGGAAPKLLLPHAWSPAVVR